MTAKDERAARLAAQLRANLRRRKAAPVTDEQRREPGERSDERRED